MHGRGQPPTPPVMLLRTASSSESAACVAARLWLARTAWLGVFSSISFCVVLIGCAVSTLDVNGALSDGAGGGALARVLLPVLIVTWAGAEVARLVLASSGACRARSGDAAAAAFLGVALSLPLTLALAFGQRAALGGGAGGVGTSCDVLTAAAGAMPTVLLLAQVVASVATARALSARQAAAAAAAAEAKAEAEHAGDAGATIATLNASSDDASPLLEIGTERASEPASSADPSGNMSTGAAQRRTPKEDAAAAATPPATGAGGTASAGIASKGRRPVQLRALAATAERDDCPAALPPLPRASFAAAIA